MNAKQMIRTRLAETVIVEPPQDNWDVQTRVVHFLKDKGTKEFGLMEMAFTIYGNDTIHITDMLRDACVDLAGYDVLSTKTKIPNVSYRLHPEMLAMIDKIASQATHH